MKRVLMITYHFPPSSAAGSFRVAGFARHLPALGWQPIVICPGVVPSEPRDDRLLDTVPPAAEVIPTSRDIPDPESCAEIQTVFRPPPSVHSPVGFLKALARGVLQKPHGKFDWTPRALRAALDVVRTQRVDLVYTTMPPLASHMVGYALKTVTRLPWVADFRDPWEFCAPETDVLGFSRVLGTFWWRRVLSQADAVVGATDPITRLNRSQYSGRRKPFVTITNGYDPEDFASLLPADAAVLNERFVLSHIGELYAQRSLAPFLDALDGFLHEDPARRSSVAVQLVGRRNDKLNAIIREKNLSDVVCFTGQLSHGDALQAAADSSALLLLQAPAFNHSVPSKFYEYIACRRPLLVLTPAESQTAAMLHGLDALRCDMDDTQAIAQALSCLYDRWRRGAVQAEHANERLARFSRPVLARELATLFDSLV